MRPETLEELRDRNLISEQQHSYLDSIFSRKAVSLYYELRIILYLGIMLFTTGAGILIYLNIGDIGHVVAIAALTILMIVCLRHAFQFAKAYTNEKVKSATPYYDYIVLLGCLLFISILTYLQLQYEVFDEGMGTTTLITSLFFFYAAYRFDHLGVLSLAITALASFFSISLSPQKWYSGNFLDDGHLYNTAIFFGLGLAILGLVLDRKGIKKHFTFTYVNFASIGFLVGCLSGIFDSYYGYAVYLIALIAGCVALAVYGQRQRSFLFLLYAFVASYIGITYFLADVVIDDIGFWFFYLVLSCGALIFFIIRFKSYFKRAE
jgi:hypothetical protein